MSLRFRFGIEGGRKTKDAADHTDTNCIPATDDFAVKFSQAGQRIIHDRDPTGSGFVKSHITGSVTHQVEPPCRISSGAGHPSHSAIGENFPYGFKGARSAPGSDHLRDWMHARTTHGRARASARELHACESKFPN